MCYGSFCGPTHYFAYRGQENFTKLADDEHIQQVCIKILLD